MKLYLAHVGFYDKEIGIYELHSNILVAAPDVQTAKQIVKKKELFVKKKMHIDGMQELSNVDGYDIHLVKQEILSENLSFSYSEVKKLY